MRSHLGSLWRCAGIALLLLAGANTAHSQGGWTVTDLGTLGGLNGEAEDINEAGHVVGGSTPPSGGDHAFLWTPSEGMVDLGTLDGSFSVAMAINNAGAVVGYSGHAFLWTEAGGMIDLGMLSGGSPFMGSFANDISEASHVVGVSGAANFESHAFLWTEADGMMDLGTLGGRNSEAKAINEAGQVVGSSETASGDEHAFLWTEAGGMVDLGTLGGASSGALDINEAGQVVGRSERASGDEHAFLWTEADGMVDLGAFGSPGSRSQAEGINDAGEVVGLVNDANDGLDRAFYWTAADGMVELPTLTGIESGAAAINNAGQVAGYADIATGDPHAAMWNRATHPPDPIHVQIDIKPGSEENPINLGSQGVIPIAILSSAAFDATTVDPSTINVEGAHVRLRGNGAPMASRQDVNGDGLMDLLVHVNTDMLSLSEGQGVVTLTASTFSGEAVIGQDSIRVVP